MPEEYRIFGRWRRWLLYFRPILQRCWFLLRRILVTVFRSVQIISLLLAHLCSDTHSFSRKPFARRRLPDKPQKLGIFVEDRCAPCRLVPRNTKFTHERVLEKLHIRDLLPFV